MIAILVLVILYQRIYLHVFKTKPLLRIQHYTEVSLVYEDEFPETWKGSDLV